MVTMVKQVACRHPLLQSLRAEPVVLQVLKCSWLRILIAAFKLRDALSQLCPGFDVHNGMQLAVHLIPLLLRPDFCFASLIPGLLHMEPAQQCHCAHV